MKSSLTSTNGQKYRQVLDVLRDEILSGRYREGEKLPSELDLVKRFGTSRITVGRAIRELSALDLIERRAGSGTYVRAPRSSGLTFGLLIPNLGETEIFEPICRGMADAGQEHALLWGNASDDEGARVEEALRLSQQFIQRRVAGVFFAPLELTPDDKAVNHRIMADLEKARIPVVLLDRCYLPYPQRSSHDLVGIDNRRAGYLAARHLVDLGCERIAFLSRRHAASTVDARIAGYRDALAFGPSTHRDWVRDFDPADLAAVERFLEEVRPEAVVCVNDRIAAGLMHALIALGRRIPHDVRIVGIDDVGYAALLPVPLTTVRQPCRDIGFAAMETMLSRIARPARAARDILLAARLVVRKSCGAALLPSLSDVPSQDAKHILN